MSSYSLNNNNNYLLNNNELGVWDKMPNELYVIGDIHGDFFALKQSLELTGCILFESYNEKLKLHPTKHYYYLNDGCEYYNVKKKNVKWNIEKKNCFIVFSGDLIDRCRPNIIFNKNCINTINDENCDYLLLNLLYDLDLQARKVNSRIIVILGNHEILHLQNNFKYISLKAQNDNNRVQNINNYLKLNISNIYGIIRINKYIIVHGGVNNIFFTEFNKNIKENKNIESIESFNNELRKFILNDKFSQNNSSIFNGFLNESPFWDRTLGGLNNLNKNQCSEIFENNLLNIKDFDKIKKDLKIIVSHCPQFVVDKTINLVDCQEYEKRIYRIDIGMSRAFDLYNIEKIKMILTSENAHNLLNINYKDFFIINNQTKNRVVSCLQLTNDKENILKGQLTIDYFYNLNTFINNNIRLIYILSDIIKIFIDNYKHSEINLNKNYYNYIYHLQTLLLLLHKQQFINRSSNTK
jgi:hypothetical protein